MTHTNLELDERVWSWFEELKEFVDLEHNLLQFGVVVFELEMKSVLELVFLGTVRS